MGIRTRAGGMARQSTPPPSFAPDRCSPLAASPRPALRCAVSVLVVLRRPGDAGTVEPVVAEAVIEGGGPFERAGGLAVLPKVAEDLGEGAQEIRFLHEIAGAHLQLNAGLAECEPCAGEVTGGAAGIAQCGECRGLEVGQPLLTVALGGQPLGHGQRHLGEAGSGDGVPGGRLAALFQQQIVDSPVMEPFVVAHHHQLPRRRVPLQRGPLDDRQAPFPPHFVVRFGEQVLGAAEGLVVARSPAAVAPRFPPARTPAGGESPYWSPVEKVPAGVAHREGKPPPPHPQSRPLHPPWKRHRKSPFINVVARRPKKVTRRNRNLARRDSQVPERENFVTVFRLTVSLPSPILAFHQRRNLPLARRPYLCRSSWKI